MWINPKSNEALSEHNGPTFIFCRLLHMSRFERFASANSVPWDSVGENSVNFCFVRSNYTFPISNFPILIFFDKWQMKLDIFLRQHWLLLSFNSFKISFFKSSSSCSFAYPYSYCFNNFAAILIDETLSDVIRHTILRSSCGDNVIGRPHIFNNIFIILEGKSLILLSMLDRSM